MADLQHARAAKSRLRTALRGREGIRGIGLAHIKDGYCLQVNVTELSDGTALPPSVDGVQVLVRVVGPIHAQS